MKSSISIINTKIVAVKKELLKIFILKPTRGLAYWFMDDGTYIYTFKKSKNRTYRFATHSFPFEDQEILVKALRGHFYGLMAATIQKHYSCYIFVQNPQSVF